VDIDDTTVCVVVEEMMKSGSDAKQLFSSVHTVLEMAVCANFDRDKRWMKSVIKLGHEMVPPKPRYPKAFDPAALYMLIQEGKSLETMALSELQWRFQVLLRTQAVRRGDCLTKWDWRDILTTGDKTDKIRHNSKGRRAASTSGRTECGRSTVPMRSPLPNPTHAASCSSRSIHAFSCAVAEPPPTSTTKGR
jgi:hypothetical protein